MLLKRRLISSDGTPPSAIFIFWLLADIFEILFVLLFILFLLYGILLGLLLLDKSKFDLFALPIVYLRTLSSLIFLKLWFLLNEFGFLFIFDFDIWCSMLFILLIILLLISLTLSELILLLVGSLFIKDLKLFPTVFLLYEFDFCFISFFLILSIFILLLILLLFELLLFI